jgi:hypothetical protein
VYVRKYSLLKIQKLLRKKKIETLSCFTQLHFLLSA